MTIKRFIEKFNGQQNVGNTTENKGQCVGLVMMFVQELNLPHIWGHAKDLFVNADEQFYTKILNTPEAIPQAGDIICWNSKMGSGYGHTAVATGTADLNTLEVFEQNNPTGSNCHLRTYSNYNNVIGWLHPKAPPIADTTNYKTLYEEKVKLETFLRGEIQKKDETINNLNNQISDLEKEKNRLVEELKQQKQELKGLKECPNNLLISTQELNQANQNYEKAKGDWSLKEINYNKNIKTLETKLSAYKMPIKTLLVNIYEALKK